MPDSTTTTKTVKKVLPAARKKKPGTAVKATDSVQVAAKMKPLDVAYVPDIEVSKRYIHRHFDVGGGNRMLDMEVYDYAFTSGFNLLLEGPTGPGKTMATRSWAASRGKMLARIPSQVGIDASQLFGRFVPDGPGRYKWVDGPVTHVFRYGGVILWNEINFTPERIASVMFGALDDNREIVLLDHESEVVRAHKGKGKCWCDLKDCDELRVLIVADMNPDYLGTRELNAALRNRFALQLDWDYDTNVEAQLIKSPSLRQMITSIRAQARTNSFQTPVSTNMAMEFERITVDTSAQFAAMIFVNHFAPDERPAVKLVVEQFVLKIRDDLKPKVEVPKAPEKPAEAEAWDTEDMDDMTDWFFAEDGDN